MKDLGSKFSTAFNFVIIGILITTSYIILYFFSVDSSGSFFLPVIISTQLLFIVLCLILYSRFIIVLKEQISLSFTLEKNKLEQAYNKKIEKSLRELHSLRHDMRNHLLIIDGYAQKNDNEKVHNYASKLIGDLNQTAIIDTPSPIVSSLLSIKYEEMIQASIQFHHTLLFDSIRISEKDITIILGNLLDNAITAAGKCNDGYINLEIKQISNMLEIHIENNHIEHISESNDTFITSKNDPNHLHGLGIKNVRATVNRLHGQINISYTGETFSVDLLLPN
jgi:sensor histidine kinase regulating citrate/malate metabolism